MASMITISATNRQRDCLFDPGSSRQNKLTPTPLPINAPLNSIAVCVDCDAR